MLTKVNEKHYLRRGLSRKIYITVFIQNFFILLYKNIFHVFDPERQLLLIEKMDMNRF